MYDLMYKADDKAAWDAWSISSGLANEFDGAIYPEPGVLIDEIGPIVITPAVVGPDGNIITPAVVDDHFFVNVRVLGNQDCAVLAQGGAGVEWISPSAVTIPDRVWAGGMNYWTPVTNPVT